MLKVLGQQVRQRSGIINRTIAGIDNTSCDETYTVLLIFRLFQKATVSLMVRSHCSDENDHTIYGD